MDKRVKKLREASVELVESVLACEVEYNGIMNQRDNLIHQRNNLVHQVKNNEKVTEKNKKEFMLQFDDINETLVQLRNSVEYIGRLVEMETDKSD